MTRYIDQLNETTDPVSGDYLLICDASAGATDKDRKVNINKFAILANAQSFTTTQTIAPSATNVDGLIVNMPTFTANAAAILKYNSVTRFTLTASASNSSIDMAAFDNSSSIGPAILVRNNSNATTPAAGSLGLFRKGGSFDTLWVDNSGNLRIWASNQPTSATDTSGTVVGTQTSSADSKNISEALPSLRESFAAILEAARNGLRSWSYKSGAFNNEFFPNGIVTDLAPRYGMDRDEAHPAGKSLNIPVAIGDLIASISILHERITALEGA